MTLATFATPFRCSKYAMQEVRKARGRPAAFQSELRNTLPLPMLSTDTAIHRLRRDLTLGSVVRGLLLAAAVASLVVLPVVAPQVHSSMALLAVGAVWIVLGYNSAKGSRLSADAPALIAAGQYDEAEERLSKAVGSFSLFRQAKLQTLHQFAQLRHAQKRYADAARLCQEVLGQRNADRLPMAKAVRLLQADALLELDDVRGTHGALSGLYGQRLSLAEVLVLLVAQLDYEARVGAWDRMMHEAMTKVQLAELMSSPSAARAQALLALAAGRSGRPDFRDWLRARAELLVDSQSLVARRPMLAEVWADPAANGMPPAALPDVSGAAKSEFGASEG
jgi:tetratricopeptide (TPR) repeat protein